MVELYLLFSIRLHGMVLKLIKHRAKFTLWRREKSRASARNRTPVVQPVAHTYTDRAIADSSFIYLFKIHLATLSEYIEK
jgi:hypothetical protein